MIDQLLKDGVDGGIDPAEVARQVVAAVKAEQFWILTHPEESFRPVERMQRAAAQENPG